MDGDPGSERMPFLTFRHRSATEEDNGVSLGLPKREEILPVIDFRGAGVPRTVELELADSEAS